VCSAEQNLWICLLCGNVGCGRYDSAHAFAHWEGTGHSFAMDVATQHVWDYAGDGYVHRLINNKGGDGKLVDLPGAAAGRSGMAVEAYGADMVPREKMEAMGNEYTYLLTSQLEQQRSYYEEQVERAADKAKKAQESAEKNLALAERSNATLASLKNALLEARSQAESLAKELAKVKQKAEKVEALAKSVTGEWKTEKTVNSGLLERIAFLDKRVQEGEEGRKRWEEEKRELEEQNRDLSVFISSGEKLREVVEREGEEVVEGVVSVGEGREKDKGRRKRK
jgi:BRCA1-associated protein